MEVIRQEFTDPHYEMYGIYEEVARNRYQEIDVNIFDSIETISSHFYNILNIFRDGIESWQVQSSKINVKFADGIELVIPLTAYFFNLIFWHFPVSVGEPITSRFLYYPNGQTQGAIKNYIDNNFIIRHQTEISNRKLNNIIDDSIYIYKYVDEFSSYLANTANNEDTVKLMMENPEFYNCVHCSVADVPIEDVKNEGMNYTNRGIDIMKNSGYHWGEPYFKSGQGINIKQLKEVLFSIGSKPKGDGSVFPMIIDSNFSMGALREPGAYIIEANNGRVAQILSKNNVGTSGSFARILGLNNQETRLHPDPTFICDTKRYIKITITNEKMLSRYKKRWYRFSPNGMEYQLSSTPIRDNKDLIGKTLYFRSPITCASRVHGKGVCFHCYGGLAYTNYDINIGQIASEIVSSELTQKLLSAKHLLESLVKEMKWVESFFVFFEVQYNLIRIRDDFAAKRYRIRINTNDIEMDDEMDDFEYNEYLSSFDVIDPDGNVLSMYTMEMDNLYIAIEFKEILSKRKPDEDGYIYFDMEELQDSALFLVRIMNNELSATLEGIKKILNKQPEVRRLATIDNMVTALVETIINGGLTADAIHAEILLANQCIAKDDPLESPHWEYPDEEYQMITLNEALMNNPSVTISLMYQNVAKQLYTPLTYKKRKPATEDLYFMTQPQNYMTMETTESDLVPENEATIPFTIEDTE